MELRYLRNVLAKTRLDIDISVCGEKLMLDYIYEPQLIWCGMFNGKKNTDNENIVRNNSSEQKTVRKTCKILT